MPIIKSGYRSDDDKAELARFYNSPAWKRARRLVRERANGVCEWCGAPPDEGQALDVIHLAGDTLELLRGAGNPLDLDQLAAGHRRCHSGYSSGRLGRPGRR